MDFLPVPHKDDFRTVLHPFSVLANQVRDRVARVLLHGLCELSGLICYRLDAYGGIKLSL